jgi:hypothetical protein
MKTSIALIACLLTITTLKALGQNAEPPAGRPPEPLPLAAPAPPAVVQPPAKPPRAPTPAVNAAHSLALAQAAADRAEEDLLVLHDKLGSLSSRGARAGRTLIVPASAPEPKAVGQAEEDLAVMSRVLDKATAQVSGEGDRRMAMGIELFTPYGPSSALRNLYLEGYGAIFFLSVRFPLLPPPERKEEAKPREPGSNEWEEARQELFGGGRDLERAPRRAGRGAAVKYDAGRVEELKTGLLEALKNATHIRALKPEETVTVVVMGGGSARTDSGFGGGGFGGGGFGGGRGADQNKLGELEWEGRIVQYETAPGQRDAALAALGGPRSSSRRSESTLSLRVKKSDVDAFAQSKLDLDEFRKRATVLVY